MDSELFNIDIPTRKPKVGSVLVAEPFLREDYFNHAAILLVDYTRGDSAMGLVLNKPTGYTLGQAVEGIDDEIDLPLYCGGPLSHDRLFYIHSLGNTFDGAREIAPALYIGGDFDRVCSYVNMGLETEGKIRFFLGYSGWEQDQLESEIRNHVWAVDPTPSLTDLFRPGGDSEWYRFVRALGPRYRNWLYHPVNPYLN